MNLKEQDRREFLRSVSMLAGTSVMATYLPWLGTLSAQGSRRPGPADTVRLGLIGSGSRGQYLFLLLKGIPGMEMVAICDDYPPNLEQGMAMAEGKAKGYADYRNLLDDKSIDGVIIATPLYQHAHMVIDALKAGKQVFCEKAMARTTEDCMAMVRAQQETGNLLLIGHQRMFDPKYLRAFEWIRSGLIGPVTQMRAYWHRNNDWRRVLPSPDLEKRFNWRLYREFSAGLMTELASHQIQVTNYIMDEIPNTVMGAGSINYWKDGREVYDNVNLVYTYPSGTQLVYDSMTSNKHYGLEEQIMGPLGTIELEAGKIFSENPPPAPGIIQMINQIEHKVFDVIPIGGPSWVPDNPSEDKGRYILDRKPEDDGTRLQMEGFAEAIRTGEKFPGLLKEAYYASIVSLLGEQAIDTGQVIALPRELAIL